MANILYRQPVKRLSRGAKAQCGTLRSKLLKIGAQIRISVRISLASGCPYEGYGHIQNKTIYVVMGINLEGGKEVLGLWVGQAEGAKFWLQVLTELKNRGGEDIFIACVDGLKRFPQAIETVFPKTQVQPCIVHLVRSCLQPCTERWDDTAGRREVAGDGKGRYFLLSWAFDGARTSSIQVIAAIMEGKPMVGSDNRAT